MFLKYSNKKNDIIKLSYNYNLLNCDSKDDLTESKYVSMPKVSFTYLSFLTTYLHQTFTKI